MWETFSPITEQAALVTMSTFTMNGNDQNCVVIISTPDDRRDTELSATNEWNMRAIFGKVFLHACKLLLDRMIQVLF